MSFDELFKKKVPTLEQLRTLIRFVEHGSLPKAFGEGKSAQAAATQQLGRIDSCFGIKTRQSLGSRKVPTDEAREMAGFCREFFQRLEDFQNRSRRKPNSFVIGAGDSLIFYLLMPALGQTTKTRGSVELQLQNLRSHDIVAGVRNGAIDLGLVRTDAVKQHLLRQGVLKIAPICSLQFAFFVRSDHLGAFKEKLTDENSVLTWASRNLPLATYWGERSTFTDALIRSKLKWSTNLRCQSFPQVKEAVLTGKYCGILPRIAFHGSAYPEIYSFGAKVLAGTSRKYGMVWSTALTDRRPGGDALLASLKVALKAIGQNP